MLFKNIYLKIQSSFHGMIISVLADTATSTSSFQVLSFNITNTLPTKAVFSVTFLLLNVFILLSRTSCHLYSTFIHLALCSPSSSFLLSVTIFRSLIWFRQLEFIFSISLISLGLGVSACVYAQLHSHVRVQLFLTLCTVACQTPLSMGFSRQEYWSGLPCPPPGCLPNSGTEQASNASLHCRQILYHWATGETLEVDRYFLLNILW